MSAPDTAKGRFIVFEGGEGAGKSTQISNAQSFLEDHEVPFVTTREPGGTGVGELIRSILLDKTLDQMHMHTELLLMFAARAEHLQKKIMPALAAGQWVLCDRFTDASYAYQGYGRGVPTDRLEVLENWVQGALRPDLVVILDIDVKAGLERVAKRGEKDRFEEERMEFFEKVRNGYLQRAKANPKAYAIVDAAQSEQRVTKDLIAVLEPMIKPAA